MSFCSVTVHDFVQPVNPVEMEMDPPLDYTRTVCSSFTRGGSEGKQEETSDDPIIKRQQCQKKLTSCERTKRYIS